MASATIDTGTTADVAPDGMESVPVAARKSSPAVAVPALTVYATVTGPDVSGEMEMGTLAMVAVPLVPSAMVIGLASSTEGATATSSSTMATVATA